MEELYDQMDLLNRNLVRGGYTSSSSSSRAPAAGQGDLHTSQCNTTTAVIDGMACWAGASVQPAPPPARRPPFPSCCSRAASIC